VSRTIPVSERNVMDKATYIKDGAIGCRNCGDTWERAVSADGTVAPCEDCGDFSYSLHQQIQTGWLLERGMTPEGPEYLAVEAGAFTWTTDNLKALRLARREDGDRLAEIVDDCQHVREHQWG
jgi:hypothetical protein